METLVKADIFFFITSVVVILLAVLVVVILVYVARILRDAKHISERVREETDVLTGDIEDLRGHIKREGVQWRKVAQFFGIVKKPRKRSGVKHYNKNEKEN